VPKLAGINHLQAVRSLNTLMTDLLKKAFDEASLLPDKMAAEAMAEHRAGKTLPLDPDKL
jgi:hypothetical protein